MTKTLNKFIAIFVVIALVVSFTPSVAFAHSNVSDSEQAGHTHTTVCSHSSDGDSSTNTAIVSSTGTDLTQYQESKTLTEQGTTFPVHTIKKNVDDNEAMVLLIMGDGFKSDQQEKFLEAAKVRAEALLRVEPYRTYANNINIYAMEVVSNAEGVSQTGYPVDTYLGVLQYNDRDAKFRNSQSDGSSDESGNSKYEARTQELKTQVEQRILTSSTTFEPSVNFVHIISNKDYYFGQSQNYGTYSFSSLSDSSFPTGSTFVHELSHSVGKLADEYSYSLSGKHNIDDFGKSTSNVRWSKLIGFHGTGIFQGTAVGTGVATAAVPSNYCIMKNNGNYTYWWAWASGSSSDAFCEVCKLELAKKIMGFNEVSKSNSLYVGMPEITIQQVQHSGVPYLLDNYRVKDYEYNEEGTTYSKNDLAQKANGKEIEFRTVVQNVDKTKDRNIKVRLTTYKDGKTTVKQTAESEVVKVGHAGVYTYTYYDYGIEKTGERDDILSYTYERESCKSISVKLQLDSDYTSNDHILGEVIDADTNEVLSTDKDLFNSRSNSNLNIEYIDEDTNAEIANTGGGKIPMKQLSTYNVTHPSSVNGYVYTKNSSSDDKVTTGTLRDDGHEDASQTLKLYFKKVDQSTCEHAKTYTKMQKEATCVEAGIAKLFCSTCGKDLNKTSEIKAKGHTYVKQDEIAAKCGVSGTSEYEKCVTCGDEKGKTTIPALAHQYENGVCKFCGEKQPSTECQHTGETTTTVTNQPSCTQTGTKITTCSTCHSVISTESIPATGHKLSTVNSKEATCTDNGYTGDIKCSVCGTVSEQGKTLSALGHDYRDGKCTRCEASEPVEKTIKPTLVNKSGGNVTFDKTEYKPGETAKLTIKNKQIGDNMQVVKSVKVNGITVKTQKQLVDKSSWASSNDEYKRKMNENVTSVEFDKLVEELSSGVSVNIAINSTTDKVEVEFEELVPVYRLYNSITSEHLFTTSKTEYDEWVSKSKSDSDFWIGEGINWFAPKSGESTVTRLYNPTLGALGRTSHYYTSDAAEIKELTTKHGWIDEASDGKTFSSGGDIPIWTCYNEALGSAHHYTSSKTEWTGLAKHGWDLEKSKNNNTGVFKATMSAVS